MLGTGYTGKQAKHSSLLLVPFPYRRPQNRPSAEAKLSVQAASFMQGTLHPARALR